jgi:hypothetical protein
MVEVVAMHPCGDKIPTLSIFMSYQLRVPVEWIRHGDFTESVLLDYIEMLIDLSGVSVKSSLGGFLSPSFLSAFLYKRQAEQLIFDIRSIHVNGTQEVLDDLFLTHDEKVLEHNRGFVADLTKARKKVSTKKSRVPA